ncbi:MAG: PAS domain S-box protein [Myxococcales bacterium]|nr:MAG: PAS domain S-box protein [Myxococcales bacterium]
MPWVVLVLSLIATVFAWHITNNEIDRRTLEHFDFSANAIVEKIQDRLHAYEMVLRGAHGFFLSSEKVTREEWRAYVASLRLDEDFPGIQGIGFSEYIPVSEWESHIQAVRAEGFPDYTIKPAGERAEYTAIVFLEPFDWRNQRAFGYDMFSEEVRRAAMTRARDSGMTAVSGKVRLVQETDKDIQAGMLMYLPLYRKGIQPSTLADRKAALVGYVYSPFRMDDLMRGILDDELFQIDLKIYDGFRAEPAGLMHCSGGDSRLPETDETASRFAMEQRIITVYGQPWTLQISTLPEFSASIDYSKPRLILALGLVAGLLLFSIAWLLATLRVRAERLAERMTVELNQRNTELAQSRVELVAQNVYLRSARAESERLGGKFQSLYEFAPIGYAMLDETGGILDMNRRCRELLELESVSAGQPFEDFLHDHHSARFGEFLSHVIASPRIVSMEFQLERGSKESFWARLGGASMPSADNEGSRLLIAIEDITVRRRAETALVESETKFRAIGNAALDAVVMLDPQGRVAYFNPAAERMFGFAKENILGLNFHEVVGQPEDYAKFRGNFDHFSKTGQGKAVGHVLEITARRRDGVVFPIEVAISSMLIQEEWWSLGMIRDITRRKQMEEKLRHREAFERIIAKLAARFVNLPLGETESGVREALKVIGQFVMVDRAYALLFEDESDRVTRRYVWHANEMSDPAAFPPMLPLALKSRWHRQLSEGSFVHIPDVGDLPPEAKEDRRLLEAAGVRSLILFPMLDRGRSLGFLGFDSMHATREWDEDSIKILRTAADLFASVFVRQQEGERLYLLTSALEAAANGVVITDRESNILWVNNAFTKLTGFSKEETIGQNPRILKSGRHEDAYYKDMLTTIHAGKVWWGEVINKRKDGQFYIQDTTVTPVLGPDREVTHFIAVAQDVTLRKEVEEELRQAKQAAESAARSKAEFLANMSHEIRTPLNGIVGMLNLLEDSDLTHRQNEFVELAKVSSESLMMVINDILDFSKIEAGKLELEAKPFDMEQEISRLLTLFSGKAADKGIELICRFRPGAPRRVIGDALRLRQVFFNLVGNAIKFTAKGRVLVDVRGGVAPGDDRAEFTVRVSDTGIGMPQEMLPTIFDHFTQVDASTTRKFGGTGLGLAITKQLIELMGGQIAASSKLDSGSTFEFTISLPIAQVVPLLQEGDSELVGGRPNGGRTSLRDSADGAIAEIPNASAVATEGMRVLLAEDHWINQKAAKTLLEALGCRVTVAGNGQAAVEAASRERYDVILMDVQMPEMDGYAATSAIRALQLEAARTPIIAMTANALQGDRERCLQAGMNDYLAKPFRKEELMRMLALWSNRGLTAISPPAVNEDVAPSGGVSESVLALQEIMNRYDNNTAFIRDLVTSLCVDAPQRYAELRRAYEANDFATIDQIAHKLKGGASFVGARRLRDVAENLMQAAGQADGKALRSLLDRLREEITLLEEAACRLNDLGKEKTSV